MSVLSEWDIINELGRGILIYPFKDKEKSIRGCCLCLTASDQAYMYMENPNHQKETKSVVQTGSNNNKFILIPKRTTAVVWTNESVWLSGYFCGSIHSKVKLVSKGLGHIGTRVNPKYGGPLAIALHNLSENDIQIDIGETIAYLRIYRLNSKSSFSEKGDGPGKIRDAIPEGFPTPTELNTWIRHEHWREGDKEVLKEALVASQGYQAAKKKLWNKSIRYRFIFKYLPKWDAAVWFAGIAAIAAIYPYVAGLAKLILPSSPNPTPTIPTKPSLAPTPTKTPSIK